MSTLAALLAALTVAAVPEAPAAPAGSPAAPLPDAGVDSPWRLALSTGVAGKFGGRRISAGEDNRSVLLFFAGQADGSWPDGHGQAARLRLRLFTGGESDIYVPSDGEAELAYALGRREFRFVLARVEVARQPGLALQVLAQAGTLPCFEGTVSLGSDAVQLTYLLAPVEAAWVRYYGGAHVEHVPGWTREDDRPSAASAGRLRWALHLDPAVALSLAADVLKFWGRADLLLAAEGALGYQLPRQGAAFHLGVRWASYTRRGLVKDTRDTSAEVIALGSATLAF